MSRKFLTNIDLNKNQLLNVIVQNLTTTSANALANVGGQIYYDTDTLALKYNNGSGWVSTAGTFGTVASLGSTNSDGSGTAYARSNHVHGHANGDHGSVNISALAAPTANVSWNSYKITSLLDPTSAQDAATKAYVDTVATGMNAHDAVTGATTADFTSLGTYGTVNYSNGTSGVGATLTASTNGVFDIDGVAALKGSAWATGDRVLVKNQTTAAQNGIYYFAAAGDVGSASTTWKLTRALDADTLPELGAGDFSFVLYGTANGKFTYIQTNKISTIGTDSVNYTVLSNGNLTSTVQISQGGTGAITASAARSALSAAGKYAVANPSITVAIGGTASWTVNHALNSVNVIVQVRSGDVSATNGAIQDVDVTYTDANNVTLQWISTTTNIAAGQYTVTVIG